MHDHVVLKVVVDPVGRNEGTCDAIGVGGAHILQRVFRHLSRAMLCDIAYTQNKLEPRQIG